MNQIDINNPIGKAIIEDSVSVITDIKKALVGLKPRITEDEFVSKYLPFLTARNLKDANGNIVPVDLNHWMVVSGNAFNPVDVVDNSGRFLFEVPPINRPGATTMHVRSKGSLSLLAIGDLYPKMLELNPRGNVNMLANEYFKRYGHSDVTTDAIAWMQILERYNMLHTLKGVDAEPVITNEAVPVKNTIDESVEWEDF